MAKLLNYTKKTSIDFSELHSKPWLLYDPFDKAISRLEYKPDAFHFDLASEKIVEVLKYKSSHKTWADCNDSRACEIENLNYDKYILMYSGGIDSTNMLSAIFRNWSAKNLAKLTLAYSHHSIDENPEFYNSYIHKYPYINSLENLSLYLRRPKTILITGELGDQLFGSDILLPAVKKYGDNFLNLDYKTKSALAIAAYIGHEQNAKKIFNHFLPITEECPFKLASTHDFFWWLNFTQKWQHVKYRFLENQNWPLKIQYGKQILHFYDTLDFQHWSLHNHSEKKMLHWNDYKMTAKNYIYSFTKKTSQLNLKKVQSLEKTYILSEKRIAVLSNMKEIKSTHELIQYAR